MERVNNNLINWAVACVSEFGRQRELTLKVAFKYLLDYGGIGFIKEHYEAEHLLSIDDAINDLSIICRNNGGVL